MLSIYKVYTSMPRHFVPDCLKIIMSRTIEGGNDLRNRYTGAVIPQ